MNILTQSNHQLYTMPEPSVTDTQFLISHHPLHRVLHTAWPEVCLRPSGRVGQLSHSGGPCSCPTSHWYCSPLYQRSEPGRSEPQACPLQVLASQRPWSCQDADHAACSWKLCQMLWGTCTPLQGWRRCPLAEEKKHFTPWKQSFAHESGSHFDLIDYLPSQ